MASSAFRVEGVVVGARNALFAQLSQQPDAVDPVDPRDCLSPHAWSLTGRQGAPFIVAAVLAAPAIVFLATDADFAPGGTYSLALAPLARSAYGFATETAAVTFTAPTLAALATQASAVTGGDIGTSAQGGDLLVVDRLTALRKRLETRTTVRKAAFAHLPNFGRGLERGRAYSVAALAREAGSMKADLLTDADVAECKVSIWQSGHMVNYSVVVRPSFHDKPLELGGPFFSGETG